MNYTLYIVVAVLLIGMVLLSRRNKQRQILAEKQRAEKLVVGAEVMTTSGLYGTVVSKDDQDDTVMLSIAPGVEVKWAIAAMRDASSLSERYRKPLVDADDESADAAAGTDGLADGPVDLGKSPRPRPARKSRSRPDEDGSAAS